MELLKKLIAVIIFFASACIPAFASTPSSLQKQLTTLETNSGGRLGVYVIDISGNIQLQYRGDERFPFCSTFKMMGVAAVLKQSMTNNQLLQQQITYTKKDLDSAHYSPITKNNLTHGMTINALCAAAIQYSDNAAINLLMKQLGGPAAVTAFARSIGDNTFNLVRWEPELNTAIPGDLRDTTTPKAMAESLQRLALGNALAAPQREQLQTWLKGNTTGDARIRAGVPNDWIVGDKTGTGDYGTSNDIAIIWPPHHAPIILVVYFTQPKQDAAPNDKVIAEATRIIISTLE